MKVIRNRLKITILFVMSVILVIAVISTDGCGNSELPATSDSDEPVVQYGFTYVIAALDSVKKEGADFICDGVDDQVEIQAAIDALTRPEHFDQKQSGGRIILLDGNYYLTDSIKYRNYMALEGQGLRITALHNQTYGKYAFEAQPHNTALHNISLSGFSIWGIPDSEGGGIHLESVKNSTLKDIEIREHGGTALWVDGADYGSWYNYLENIYCVSSDVGIRIESSSSPSAVNEFTFIGGNVNSNRRYNLDIRQGSGHKFMGTVFEGGEVYLDRVTNCIFLACRFEGIHFFNGPNASNTVLIGGRRTGWSLTDENGNLTNLQNAYLKVDKVFNGSYDWRFGSAEIIGDGNLTDFIISHDREDEPSYVLITATNENMALAEHWISKKGEQEFTISFDLPPNEGQLYTFDWVAQ